MLMHYFSKRLTPRVYLFHSKEVKRFLIESFIDSNKLEQLRTVDEVFFHNNLAPYMAGLLEGDGMVSFLDKDTEKDYYVMIKYTFHKDDKPFVEFLRDLFNIGYVYTDKKKKTCTWRIYDSKDVYNFLYFIKDYFRTAKVVTLQKAFDTYYKRYGVSTKVNLDTSNILSNSWLAGFSDADSCFKIEVTKKKVYTFIFQIKVAENYILVDPSYDIYRNNRIFMEPLAKEFDRRLLTGQQKPLPGYDKITYYLRFTICSLKDLNKIFQYFATFPIFSSKYHNYCDLVKAFELRNKANAEGVKLSTIHKELEEIKSSMNSKRDPNSITWSHLDNFYKLPEDYPNFKLK